MELMDFEALKEKFDKLIEEKKIERFAKRA